MTTFAEPFESIFRCPVEIALVNREKRAGIIVANPPGRLLVSGRFGPFVVPNSSVTAILTTGRRLDDFIPTRATFGPPVRSQVAEGQYADLVDFIGGPTRLGLVAGGEFKGELVDVSPMGAEWLGICRDNGSTVYLPLAAVAVVEPRS